MAVSRKKTSKKAASKKKVVPRKKTASKKKVTAANKTRTEVSPEGAHSGESPSNDEQVALKEKETVSSRKISVETEAPAAEGASPGETPIKRESVDTQTGAEQSAVEVDSFTEESHADEAEELVSNSVRAAESRRLLFEQLRLDFHAGRNTLKAFGVAAKREFRLVREVADSEYAVVKEQLSATLKRENSLLNAGRRNAGKILSVGERWGRRQLSRVKDTADRIRNKAGK